MTAGLVEAYFSKNTYLPVQPVVRKKMIGILESNASMEVRRAALEEAVYAFPLVAYNLLRYINSDVFKLKTKIVVLKQAVSLPTIDKLSELIRAMPEVAPEVDEKFSLSRFEEHARATALSVQILATLAKKFSTLDRERVYTAAMIHDVGRLFLVMSDIGGYMTVFRESADMPSVIEAERKYYGTDHAVLGGLAAEAAGIKDADVLTAIKMHHDIPTGAGVLLAYADRIVKRFGIGPSGGTSMNILSAGQDDNRLKAAVEEEVHMTIGEILMHVLSEVDTQMAGGMVQFKMVVGAV